MGRTRLCVLQCTYEDSTSCWAGIDPPASAAIYDKDGKYEWTSVFVNKATAVKEVQQLARSKKWDVFINLCDGGFDEDRAGIEVVHTLERAGVPFTGGNSTFYEPSKAEMKAAAFYYGIHTAPWALMMEVDLQDDAAARAQCEQAVEGLKFPLICKHYSGGGSVGMGRDCKVHDMEQLVAQVRKFVGEFGGVLVEEFIEGREFTVLVLETSDPDCPRALVPVECVFGSGESFKHFDLKWHDYDSMSWKPVDVTKEPELDAALRSAACASFKALRGVSYGRADFRVDSKGTVYFLEMNPNCGLFYPPDAMGSADFILSLDPEVGHMQFIDAIVSNARMRVERARNSQLTDVRYRHAIGGFGLYATRDITPGEVVIKYEERPHTLVTRRHIEATFGRAALPGPCPADAICQRAMTAGCCGLLPSQAMRAGAAKPIPRLTAVTAAQHSLCSLSSASPASSSHGSLASLEVSASAANQSSSATASITSESGEASSECGENATGVCVKVTANTCEPLPGDAAAEASALAAAAGTGQLPLRAEWFRAYAYPITDETWVTWAEDPREWLPINHACDPNSWLQGLDLVARRPIRKGEQITADYATFTVHNMREFTCRCGSPSCRGVVRGTDYLQPWVGQVYGEEHVSDYVAAKRRMLAQAHAAQSAPHSKARATATAAAEAPVGALQQMRV